MHLRLRYINVVTETTTGDECWEIFFPVILIISIVIINNKIKNHQRGRQLE